MTLDANIHVPRPTPERLDEDDPLSGARLSLREAVIATVRTRIITGELTPGEICSVPSLSAMLGTSATPVREAMLHLANEGFVESLRNRGYRVVPMTEHDLDEVFDLRMLLEVPAVGRLTGKLHDDEIARLRGEIAAMEVAAQEQDLVGFLEHDRDFHLGLLALTGNQLLVSTVARLRERARLYGLPQLRETGRLEAAVEEHSDLLEALVTGAPRDQVEELMRHHLRHTRGVWAGLHEEE